MPRGIDSITLAETAKNGNYPIELVSIVLDPTDVNKNLYLSTSYKDTVHEGQTYTAGSNVLTFSAVEQSLDAKTNSVNVSLNGVPTSIIQVLEGIGIRPIGGIVTIYQGFIDPNTGNIVGTIYQKWKGTIYSYSTTEENQQDGSIKIEIECKNILVAILDSKSGRFTSPTSFEQLHTNDKSMEFVPGMINFNPNFGSEE